MALASARFHISLYVRTARKIIFRRPQYFGGLTCAVIKRIVNRLQNALGEAAVVSFATVEVLLCEVRQAVNRYGFKGCWYLVHLYQSSVVIRDAVSVAREQLQIEDDVSIPFLCPAVPDPPRASKSFLFFKILSKNSPSSVAIRGSYVAIPKPLFRSKCRARAVFPWAPVGSHIKT